MNSYINERQSVIIPIKKNTSFENCKELSITPSFIDPSQMSPPNSFMEKLIKRMDSYYSPTNKSHKSFSFEK